MQMSHHPDEARWEQKGVISEAPGGDKTLLNKGD